MRSKTEILKEIGELQARWLNFKTDNTMPLLDKESGDFVLYRRFLNREDFEKKYLQEAADKISAIYEEKIFKKFKELVAIYENEENQQGKLGYAFTWLMKLDSAADDEEREKILQDWLAELAEKKPAEVATE